MNASSSGRAHGRGAPLGAGQAVLLVARREFDSQVRSRSFVIGLLITLALFAGFGLLSSFIAGQDSDNSLGLTPETAPLRTALVEIGRAQGVELDIRELEDGAGRAQVDAGELAGLLTGGPGDSARLARDAGDGHPPAGARGAGQQQVLTTALTGAGIDPAQLTEQQQVAVVTVEPVDPDRGQRLALAIVGTILLFISFSGYGQLVATGVVEEKQSRVVELLLATIKPWQLLAGKILGLGAVGLLQLVILGVIGVVGAGGPRGGAGAGGARGGVRGG